jgi:hypothetical protein
MVQEASMEEKVSKWCLFLVWKKKTLQVQMTNQQEA